MTQAHSANYQVRFERLQIQSRGRRIVDSDDVCLVVSITAPLCLPLQVVHDFQLLLVGCHFDGWRLSATSKCQIA